MNAAFKPGLQGRDVFAGYLCDDTALETVRSVVTGMGWRADKITRGGLRGAIQDLSVSSSPAILLVDLSESADPTGDINGLAEVCEPGTIVIAIGQINDVRLYRDLVSSGLHDYLLKPLSVAQLTETLTQAQAVFNAPRTEGADKHEHVTTAVIGTRGGSGASTIATSLAWLFSTDHALRTALLDLDLHFGTGALTLDLEPGRGLSDAIENPSRIDSLFIERAMIRANENLSLLSAEASLHAPMETDGTAFAALLAEFQQSFVMTVIDLPRQELITHPNLLGSIGVITLVAEQTLASARDTIRLLAWLKSNAPEATVLIVCNKVQQGLTEISLADFEASIERKVNFILPFDAKAASQAAKLGQTFAEANPTSKTTQAICELAQAIHSTTGGNDLTTAASPSLLGRFNFKALLGRSASVKTAA